jgi:hypothetical protein
LVISLLPDFPCACHQSHKRSEYTSAIGEHGAELRKLLQWDETNSLE